MVWDFIRYMYISFLLSTENNKMCLYLVYILYIYNLYLKSHMSIGTSKFQRSVDITGSFPPFPHYRLCLLNSQEKTDFWQN